MKRQRRFVPNALGLRLNHTVSATKIMQRPMKRMDNERFGGAVVAYSEALSGNPAEATEEYYNRTDHLMKD
jgi:hypothetical protein